MRLAELLEDWATDMTPQDATQSLKITGLATDSREVRPGCLFAALPGGQHDGRAFIPQALARGASAVLAPQGTPRSALGTAAASDLPLITDVNPRRRLALMAARFFGRQPRHCAAVTGTNGKTSVAEFTRQLWAALGYQAASLGTLGLIPQRGDAPDALTTPDPVALHRCLAGLAGEGYDHLALEASSHGLDQHRLDGVRICAAAFTNLSRDHLDYHGSMAAYRAAKARLFDELLQPDGTAVLNADEPEFQGLAALAGARGLRVIDYGARARCLTILRQRPTARGQDLTVSIEGKRCDLSLPLAGGFQAWNLMAAIGLVLAQGCERDAVLAAVPRLQGVPGRVERVAETPAGGRVYVDYAHTPDALTAVLAALRPHCPGRLWVVFGCGGDRDPGKRPLMGRAAEQGSDVAVLTDDNPRDEDPATIRRQARAAMDQAIEIGDRGEAIASAMARLGPGDVLVVAGKGHETGQIAGDRVLPFDDRDVARATARRLAGPRAEAGEP